MDSQTTCTRASTIQPGNSVLLRLLNGEIRGVKVDKDATINLGRLGSFFANELINQHYGASFEIVEKGLRLLPPRTWEEVEETDATNELINDGEIVQPLTLAEIESLKQAGLHASDIIKKQIESHSNYQLKTEYSKEKYKKRKEAKYMKAFTTIEPTLFNVAEYWFDKDRNRIREIRSDTLAQMLNMCGIRSGGKYIVVDSASGLVVSGMLERLGGKCHGRLLTIHDTESPPSYPVVDNMNFLPQVKNAMVSLNWSTADEEHIPVVPTHDFSPEETKTDRHKARIKKRKILNEALADARNELFAGEFDGLIIASEYDPASILERLSCYLAGSASVVVHSPHVQIVSELQVKLRSNPEFLSPTVTEPWLRRYQVLPGRTHPMMNTSGSGGFILHAIKIYDNPEATSVLAYRYRAKRQAGNAMKEAVLQTTKQSALDSEVPEESGAM